MTGWRMKEQIISQKEVLTQQRLKLQFPSVFYICSKSQKEVLTQQRLKLIAIFASVISLESERSSNTTKIETHNLSNQNRGIEVRKKF